MKCDKTMLEAAEMWRYRRVQWLNWIEKRTKKSILDEFEARPELFAHIINAKMSFFRKKECDLVHAFSE